MSLTGKIAIVSGAGAGLGRSSALKLAAKGATVLVTDIADDNGNETVRMITDAGGTAAYRHVDSSSSQENQSLVDHIVETYGKLDIAVNNAGVAPPSTPFAEVSDEIWKRTISINLDGVFYAMRSQINAMLKNSDGGVIINMASILGQIGFPGMASYVAAKHGVVGLTKQVAVDHAKDGIRAIAIGPAFIKTGLEDALAPEDRAALDDQHPVGRMGEPEEIGDVVASVADPTWSFVNGAYLPVDGGFLSR